VSGAAAHFDASADSAYIILPFSDQDDVYLEITAMIPASSLAAQWAFLGDPSYYLMAIQYVDGFVLCSDQLFLTDPTFTGFYSAVSDRQYGANTAEAPTGDVPFTLKLFMRNLTSAGQYLALDTDAQTIDDSGCGPWGAIAVGLSYQFNNFGQGVSDIGVPGSTMDVYTIKVGTTDGGSDILNWSAETTDLAPFEITGDVTYIPPTPPPPAAVHFQSPFWRFVVLDLATFEILSFLDQFATNRTATYTLNQAAVATGRVPSDNPEVNLPWPTDFDDPFVAEGVRVLYGFRREGTDDDPPVWVPRFAGLIMQLEDTAESDVAYTDFTAYDPWQYLLSRPVCNADGSLVGPNGISFTATHANVIALELLLNTINNQGDVLIDAGVAWGGTSFYTGTIESCDQIDINFPQGTSVGDAWQQLTALDVCDIVLTPIYDPINRPRYLVEFNIYTQVGSPKDDAIFAWDRPSQSLVGITRLIEGGTQRANAVKYFAGQGGSATGGQTIALKEDAASIIKFGEYWRQQFFPNQTVAAAVEALAEAQLALSEAGRVTVTISPAPERSPQPFLDYYLGDRVPVYASSRFRAPIPAADESASDEQNYQRIYGIPLEIGDDSIERVQQLLTAIPT
jgi:hypothetical protein